MKRGDTVVGMEPDEPCDCPNCRGEAPTPDEVIVGLTVALLRKDWALVSNIAQTLQDGYGSMEETEVLSHANAEVVRLALTRVAFDTKPIEA